MIKVIYLAERRRNEYARSNHLDNSRLKEKSGVEMFQEIDNCTQPVHVTDILNNKGDRYYSWNFVNLSCGRIQTVEFRRGPGVRTNGPCITWIDTIIQFVKAALGVSTSKILQHTEDITGLWKFITEDTPDILLPLFHGKYGSRRPRAVHAFNPAGAEQEKLARNRAQADVKNLISMKVSLLFGSDGAL